MKSPAMNAPLPSKRDYEEVVRRFIDHWNQTREFPWELVDPGIVYVIDTGVARLSRWAAATCSGPARTIRSIPWRTRSSTTRR